MRNGTAIVRPRVEQRFIEESKRLGKEVIARTWFFFAFASVEHDKKTMLPPQQFLATGHLESMLGSVF